MKIIKLKKILLKNNAPFTSCILKLESTLIDNAEDLGIVMPMYDLLNYSGNYSMKSGILWDYCRDQIDGVDDNASDAKSLNYKTNIGNTPETPGNEGDAN